MAVNTFAMTDDERRTEACELLDDIEANGNYAKLSPWARDFVDDFIERRDKYEDRLLVSPRQLEKLREINEQACG